MALPASRRLTALSVVLAFVSAGGGLAAQKPPLLPPASISIDEANSLAQYWTAIAAGKANEIVGRVRQLLEQYPRSSAVLTLAIEADITVNGATSALAVYERWLGARIVDEPGVVRRIAKATLYEWARADAFPGERSEALLALADDGDGPARAAIAKLSQGVGEGALRAGVRLQSPQAIAEIAARIKASKGEKYRDLQLLGESRSPLAAPILVETLGDVEPRNRAIAATHLGHIGGPGVVDALRPLLKDPSGSVRLVAAGSMLKLGSSEGLNILEAAADNSDPRFRRDAAQLMAPLQNERWLSLVRSLLNESDPAVRVDAAAMIAPHDPEAARQVLNALALDANPAIREDVELVRAQLPTSTLAELRALMRSPNKMARVRAAGRVLAMTR